MADDGISGTNTKKRDEFNRMIDECMAGNINMIITKSISRFARNTLDCLQYIRQLKDKNIPVYFEKESINTLNSKGKVLLTIMASLAQQESQSMSQNIKLGLQYRYQQGKVQVNHNRFLGYAKDENGNLIIDPEQAEIVKRIYREYLEGSGMDKIAVGLMTDGILTGAGKTKWHTSTINKILRNEIYVGSMVQGRQYTPSHRSQKREPIPKEDWIVVPNMHEPIISRELFDEAQEKLKTRKKVCSGPSDLPHLFSGLFFCEACGSSMRQGYTQKRKYVYFSCARSNTIGSIACSTHYINYNTLYQIVLEDIKRNANLFSEDRDQATKKLMELKCADEQKRMSKMQRELASAEKRLAELDVKLKRTYEDNISGKLPDHIFSMFIADYDAEKATLKATIANIRKALEKVRDTEADIDRFAELIQKYTSFEELDRFMLNELIDRITIYETPGMGRYRKGKEKIITIYYKFVGAIQ